MVEITGFISYKSVWGSEMENWIPRIMFLEEMRSFEIAIDETVLIKSRCTMTAIHGIVVRDYGGSRRKGEGEGMGAKPIPRKGRKEGNEGRRGA